MSAYNKANYYRNTGWCDIMCGELNNWLAIQFYLQCYDLPPGYLFLLGLPSLPS